MGLILNHGTYNCGKSSDLIKIYHNYVKKGMKPIAYNIYNDVDKKRNMVMNDMGLNCPATPIEPDFNFFKDVLNRLVDDPIDIVLIDNGQYLSSGSVDSLRRLANRGLSIVVFALRSDYKGNIYSGTSALMGVADRIEEIKGMCWCNKRASMNACVDKEYNIILREITSDDTNIEFTGVCGKHWEEGKVNKGVLGNKVYNNTFLKSYFQALVKIHGNGKIPVYVVLKELGDNRMEYYVHKGFLISEDGKYFWIDTELDFDEIFLYDPYSTINSPYNDCLDSDILKKLERD